MGVWGVSCKVLDRNMVHPTRQWGEIYLKMLVIACLNNLLCDPTISPVVADLGTGLASVGAWDWASGCSGTEGHIACMCAISEGLGYCFDAKFSHEHKASAEWTALKRRWIRQHAQPQVLLSDIEQLLAQWAPNLAQTEELDDAPLVSPTSLLQGITQLVAGFSCKAVSSLNSIHAGTAASAAFSSMTSTGETFGAAFALLSRNSPACALVENVPGLCRSGQATSIAQRALQFRYAMVWLHSSPKDLWHPQDRPRVYGLLVRMALLIAAGVSVDWSVTYLLLIKGLHTA